MTTNSNFKKNPNMFCKLNCPGEKIKYKNGKEKEQGLRRNQGPDLTTKEAKGKTVKEGFLHVRGFSHIFCSGSKRTVSPSNMVQCHTHPAAYVTKQYCCAPFWYKPKPCTLPKNNQTHLPNHTTHRHTLKNNIQVAKSITQELRKTI